MKKQTLLISFVLITILLISSLALSMFIGKDDIDNIRIITEEYPPLQYLNEDNTLDGYATKVVKDTIKELNISKEIELLDWDSAYQLISEKENIALFSMMKNAEREERFKWVGPIGTLKIALYGNDFDNFGITSLDQAKKYKISAVKGYGYTENLIALGFDKIVECDSEEEALKKLLTKEVDLYLTSNITISELMKNEGLPSDAITKEFNISITPFYVAFSKNYSDALIDRWQKALQKSKEKSDLLFIDN